MSASPSQVLAGLEQQLQDLWAEGPRPGEAPKTRVCTMNLVVVAGSEELADRYTPIVDEVTRGTPARAIVVALVPDAKEASLEGDVTAVCSLEGGRDVCSERIRLVARGPMGQRLASAVEPLRVPELPTALVWLGRVGDGDPPFANLAGDARRIVLDTEYTSLWSLVTATRWARARGPAGPHVADLAWTRLAPFHEMCARFFDEPHRLPLAGWVQRIELAQAAEAGSRLGTEGFLLLAWLATRLGWRAERARGSVSLVRPDGGEVALELSAVARPAGVAPRALARVALTAAHGGRELRGTIQRELASGLGGPESTVDTDVAVWRLEETGGVPIEQRVRLRTNKGARLLERTLHRPASDPTLVEAVMFAAELLEGGEGLVCR